MQPLSLADALEMDGFDVNYRSCQKVARRYQLINFVLTKGFVGDHMLENPGCLFWEYE